MRSASEGKGVGFLSSWERRTSLRQATARQARSASEGKGEGEGEDCLPRRSAAEAGGEGHEFRSTNDECRNKPEFQMVK